MTTPHINDYDMGPVGPLNGRSAAAERLASLRERNRYLGTNGQWYERREWCAARCSGDGLDCSIWQCSRKPGHGHEGAYCKQHAAMDAKERA